MRLIDADEFYDKALKIGVFDNRDIDIFLDAIDEQPTAYDVDKVCKELESAKCPYYLFDADGRDVDESLLKADMVESIVRGGGVDA